MNDNKNTTEPTETSTNTSLKTSSYVSSLDAIVRSDSGETLGTVLSLVTSSHTPIFIFSKNQNFLGLISPYSARYLQSYPYTTKVASIVQNPPHITIRTPLYDIAKFMLESHIYILPVFSEDKNLSSVINGRELAKSLINDPELLTYLAGTVKIHVPITALNTYSVGDTFQLMSDKHVSRIIIVDTSGQVSGIASRKDLLNAYMKPTQKQRFGKSGNPETDRAFDEEKEYRKDDPVTNYMTRTVHTISVDTNQEEIIKKLLTSPHNSIVLVDKQQRPRGFISLRDIFEGIASLHPEETISLIMSRPSMNVSDKDVIKAEDHLTKFGKKMNKRIAIDKIEVHFEEPKYPTGGTIVFNTSVVLSPIAGDKIISHTKNASFLESIQIATDQIEKQERRSNTTRKDSTHASI